MFIECEMMIRTLAYSKIKMFLIFKEKFENHYFQTCLKTVMHFKCLLS